MTIPHILYSNSVEELYAGLKKNLFSNSSPFSKRIVAVPTLNLKGWLIRRLAEDEEMGICAGVEVQLLEQAVGKIATLVGNAPKNGYEPTQLQLSLAIETQLLQVLEKSHGQEVWESLAHSLGAKEGGSDGKKIRSLATCLASIFKEYGRVGPAVFEKTSEEEAWQRLLWERLENLYAVWNYPQRKLSLEPIQNQIDLHIHLFSVNLLTPLQHRYFNHIGQTFPTHYYVLSPCQKFWGDLLSNKERGKLKKKLAHQKVKQPVIEELDRYLTDTNPLLANLGKWGRAQIRCLEEIDADLEETYCLPRSAAELPRYKPSLTEELFLIDRPQHLTLLQALQTDLLLLKNPDCETKLSLPVSDHSIQIHAVPKPAREVEVVYDLILNTLHTQGVQPEEIWVAAPQISDYLPYIHAVFGDKESQIPYQVVENEPAASHLVVRGFLHFLSLAKGRWEASALLQLFEFPPFQKKHHLKSDEIALLKVLVEEAGVRWGRSPQHRQSIYDKDSPTGERGTADATGTWELAFNRALEGLILFDRGLHDAYCPLDQIHLSQGENLGHLIAIFRELEDILKPLEQVEERTLIEWVKYLKNVYDAHFSCGSEESEREGHQLILHALEELRQAAHRQENARFSSDSLLYHLNNLFHVQPIHRGESNGRVVRFGSLSHRGPIPANTLILMGMVDGAYPKAEHAPSFHLMHGEKMSEELYPRIEIEKYQFLEQLLTTQNRLIFTYPSLVGGSDQEQPRSPLVNDLLEYLDQAYLIDGKAPSQHCLKKHPLLPFHHRYFSPENEIFSSSLNSYKAALKYYQAETKTPPSFLSLAMHMPQDNAQQQKTVIALSDLSAFAKHPLKAYFRKTLGIYIDTEIRKFEQDQDQIACSPYQKAVWINQAIASSPEIVLSRAFRSGQLSKNPFTQLDASQIAEEAMEIKHHLANSLLEIQEAISIQFDERFQQPSYQEKCWHVPPLLIENEAGPITLIGRLENIHPSGILFFAEDSFKKSLELWPQLLAYFCLIDTYALPFKKNVYFAKKGKMSVKDGETFPAQQLLERYLAYCQKAQKTPSPLLPEWIPAILSGEFDSIQTNPSEDPYANPDEYLEWFNAWDKNFAWEKSFSAWQETAENLFLNLATQWHPKSIQHPTLSKHV